jgi:hypothetical protein
MIFDLIDYYGNENMNWIKTSDRLPEFGKDVLSYKINGSVRVVRYYGICTRDTKHLGNPIWEYRFNDIEMENPDYWCEIPELPEE